MPSPHPSNTRPYAALSALDFAPELGRRLFGFAALATGLRQIVTSEFARLVPGFPETIPWHPFWAQLTGVALVLAGAAIVANRLRDIAAATIAVMLAALLLFLYVPQIAGDPFTGYIWTNPCKTLALFGGAAAIAATASRPRRSLVGMLAQIQSLVPYLLGLFLVVCGLQHFIYADFVNTLVPTWIPPSAPFWTYFTGVTLVAGGIGLCLKRTIRLAAPLSALMVFGWVVLLHIPRAIGLKSVFELDGVFEALAITGVALMCVPNAQPSASPVERHGR